MDANDQPRSFVLRVLPDNINGLSRMRLTHTASGESIDALENNPDKLWAFVRSYFAAPEQGATAGKGLATPAAVEGILTVLLLDELGVL